MDALSEFRSKFETVVPREVSVGYMTVHLFEVAALEAEQLGYSQGPEGQDLTGEDDGDWRPSWLAVGYEDMCGDPIFVDLGATEHPVFTAAHGMGSWDPTLIAESFDGFVAALVKVHQLSRGREHPVALEQNPLTPEELDGLVKALRVCGGEASVEFWTDWFKVEAG